MRLVISSDLLFITIILGGYIGWKFRADRPFLRRNWSHLAGALFLYFVFFYGWVLHASRIPFVLNSNVAWGLAHNMLLLLAIGFGIGFGLNYFFAGRGRRK